MQIKKYDEDRKVYILKSKENNSSGEEVEAAHEELSE